MEGVKYILLNPPGTKKWTERGLCGKRLSMKENVPLNGGYEIREGESKNVVGEKKNDRNCNVIVV